MVPRRFFWASASKSPSWDDRRAPEAEGLLAIPGYSSLSWSIEVSPRWTSEQAAQRQRDQPNADSEVGWCPVEGFVKYRYLGVWDRIATRPVEVEVV